MVIAVEGDDNLVFAGLEIAKVKPVAVHAPDFFAIDEDVSMPLIVDGVLANQFWSKGPVFNLNM